jgi:hypothetical protein
MNIHQLTASPTSELALALGRFEKEFTYPLGPGRSFRISHGDDYSRFFRAIGEAVCFVAEGDGEVLGVLGLAATRLRMDNGQERPAIYLGDLKIAKAARSGWVLPQLAAAAGKWCGPRAECGFGVVMDGTSVTPESYTGRLGIPLFRIVAKVAVLRIPTMEGKEIGVWKATPNAGAACFSKLSSGRIGTDGGDPAERSRMSPVWLVAPDGSACGRVEDTRRAKRLIADDGAEMIAAHLSCIGYQTAFALVELLRVARAVARDRGFPALFVAIPASDTTTIVPLLGEPGIVVAPATIHAASLDPGWTWAINTAEI